MMFKIAHRKFFTKFHSLKYLPKLYTISLLICIHKRTSTQFAQTCDIRYVNTNFPLRRNFSYLSIAIGKNVVRQLETHLNVHNLSCGKTSSSVPSSSSSASSSISSSLHSSSVFYMTQMLVKTIGNTKSKFIPIANYKIKHISPTVVKDLKHPGTIPMHTQTHIQIRCSAPSHFSLIVTFNQPLRPPKIFDQTKL